MLKKVTKLRLIIIIISKKKILKLKFILYIKLI